MNEAVIMVQDLLKRLDAAVVTTQNLQVARRKDLMSTQATSRLRDIQADVDRLGGKVEGLQVAMGYLNEELRFLGQPDA